MPAPSARLLDGWTRRLLLATSLGGMLAVANGTGFAATEALGATTDDVDAVCRVEASHLLTARARFAAECGGRPRDCVPADGDGWACSSAAIDHTAPSASSPDMSESLPLVDDGACSVVAEDLAAAWRAYAKHCTAPLRDCDPLDAVRWQCSDRRLGRSAMPLSRIGSKLHRLYKRGVDQGGAGGGEPSSREALESRVEALLLAESGGLGLDAFTLPDSDDYARIPQDPRNPITDAKVRLGRLLFHDTGFALNGVSGDAGSWSCATCHNAAAGFKSGTRQGIGEGGVGFGANGSGRLLAAGFDPNAPANATNKPDLQPLASPTILNSAWQDVMLWNGQFGNAPGSVNAGVDPGRLLSAGTPKAINGLHLSGLETQAIAGSGVHRLSFENSPLQENFEYRVLYAAAYGTGSGDVTVDAGKAMAAFERTVIANRAPFQRWLRGERHALDDQALRGAELFFGEAGCIDCHRGPALSSEPGAAADQLFFALGFDDLDRDDALIAGPITDADRRGRGGFTGGTLEDYRFKIPPLYNLTDANVFGHGASFGSVREVIEYKRAGVAQNPRVPPEALDVRFRPLSLSDADVDALVAFLEEGLSDPDLDRYEPERVPSGGCVIVDARDDDASGRCP